MSISTSTSDLSGLLLSSLLTLTMVGCVPPKTADEPATAKINTLPEKAATCEASLRQKMVAKSLVLQPVAGLEAEISAANSSVLNANKTSYSLSKTTQIVSIGLELTERDATTSHGIRYDLSLSSKDSESPMNLTVEVGNQVAKSNVVVSQRFNVSQACELSISSTSKTHLSEVSSNNYSFKKITVYPDGQTQQDSAEFTTPAGATLLNLVPFSNEDLDHLNPMSYDYAEKVGLLSISVHDKKSKSAEPIKEFGLDLKLKYKSVNFSLDDKPMFKFNFGEDKTQGVSSSEVGGRTTWKLPKILWDKQNLGSSDDISSLARSEITKEYLLTHNTIQLLTNKVPSYDHFGAYWIVSNHSLDARTNQELMTLTENSNPIVYDQATAADLISNDTIQTELPQVQAIAKEILSQQPKDRQHQIQLILEYLGNHYTFDYSMVKNNSIRPLTTEEAFARGKGVCQHYAVIFTAIARALKIPSRIVAGYLLKDGSAGGHAWVEAEVTPGVWRPIEPQSPEGLTATYTRFYFPTVRAIFLEDKNSSWAEYLAEAFSNQYTFRPLQ